MDVCTHFKWLLLLSKLRRPPLLPTLIPLPVPRSERGRSAAADPNYPTVIHHPSFTSSIAALPLHSFSGSVFLPEPLGAGGGEVKDSTEQPTFGLRTEGTTHKKKSRRAPPFSSPLLSSLLSPLSSPPLLSSPLLWM